MNVAQMNKKASKTLGAGIVIGGIVIIMILVAAIFLAVAGVIHLGTSTPLSTGGGGGTSIITPGSVACSGIASVKYLYDDKDRFAVGTDPDTNVTIYDPVVKSIDDDATSSTVPPNKEIFALAGQSAGGTPSTTYFAQETVSKTACEDIDVQTQLSKAGAPTLTIVNDNGVTVNADASAEATSGGTTYKPCITVRAPTQACASKYGAILVFEYDATNVSKISTSDSDLKEVNTGVYFAHTTNYTGTGQDYDQYKTMKFGAELCDGDKAELCFDMTTVSTDSGEDGANVLVHWLPIQKDLDADTYEVLTGIYDEDNNAIWLGNTTVTYYTD